MGWGILLVILAGSFLHQSTGFQGVEDYNSIASDFLPLLLVIGVPVFFIALFYFIRNLKSSTRVRENYSNEHGKQSRDYRNKRR